MHNFLGYDSHFIVKHFQQSDTQVKGLAINSYLPKSVSAEISADISAEISAETEISVKATEIQISVTK